MENNINFDVDNYEGIENTKMNLQDCSPIKNEDNINRFYSKEDKIEKVEKAVEPKEDNAAQIFAKLDSIDLTSHLKTKMDSFRYLNWAWAWKILKNNYPNSSYKIYTRTFNTKETKVIKDENLGTETTVESNFVNELPYFTDNNTCFVKVGVTVNGIEMIEYLPIMDKRNHSVAARAVTSMDINNALQRAFVKACARHGLGLYVYARADSDDAETENSTIKVDFDKLIAQANDIAEVPASEKGKFMEHRQNVMELVKEIKTKAPETNESIIKEIKLNTKTRISEMKEDQFLAVYRIEKFLLALKANINE